MPEVKREMAFHFFATGGTGAKCLSATIHLAAAGLFPAERLVCRFFDPDLSNGSVARAKEEVRLYERARSSLPSHPRLFKTVVDCPVDPVWSPFKDDFGAAGTEETLSAFFDKTSLTMRDKAAANMMDVLYTQREQQEPLGVGFRGRPAIGSAVLARLVRGPKGSFWDEFLSSIKSDAAKNKDVTVFLAGSVFGGTGAAGVPTLGKALKKWAESEKIPNLRVGAVLLLPYFSFGASPTEVMAAAAGDFVRNTRSALEYYRWQRSFDVFNAVYILGESTQERLNTFEIAGENQRNPPHITELVAASAAADFALGRKGIVFAARQQSSRIDWSDLPWGQPKTSAAPAAGKERDMLRRYFIQSARFSIVLHRLFAPMMRDISTNGQPHRAPWFVDYFLRHRKGVDNGEWERLDHVLKYTRSQIRWQAAVSDPAQGVEVDIGEMVSLFDHAESVSRDTIDRADLLDPERGPDLNFSKGLTAHETLDAHQVWSRTCANSPNAGAAGMGYLLHAIYDACAL